MKQAVVFGAGNIGRGFIGQLFAESGYEVTFIDIDRELIEYFQTQRGYDLQTVFNDDVQDYRISPVTGIMADDAEAAVDAVAAADIAATAVGARALRFIAPTLAVGIAKRAANDAPPLNVILCENLKSAARLVREMVADETPAPARDYLAEKVGFVDPVIGRMVPPPDPAQREENLGLIRVEPYKELPVDKAGFVGPIPDIVGMTAHDNFAVFTARKLYIHNCGHALIAYRGWLENHEYGWQALQNEIVRDFLFAGWEESLQGIVQRYDADADWLHEHMQDLFERFQNRALGDTIFRLGRDPIRKLGPTDRLVAPATLAMETGNVPETLAAGIAAACCFDALNDPVAIELQQRLKDNGIEQILTDVCQIDPNSKLGHCIQAQYKKIKTKPVS